MNELKQSIYLDKRKIGRHDSNQKSLARLSVLIVVVFGDGKERFKDDEGEANNCLITPLAFRGVRGG